MGINIRVQKNPKDKDTLRVEAGLEKDLRECMRCKFFYGSNNRCITNQCVKEAVQQPTAEKEIREECLDCPYRQSGQYCFPCMKKLLGITEEKQHEKTIE